MSVLLLLLAMLAVLLCATAGSLIVQPLGIIRRTEGEALRITCIHDGSGAGEWRWIGPAVPRRASVTREPNRSRLHFSALSEEDNGTYVCLFANEAATVEIIVQRNPRILNVSKQQNVTENTTGFILCPVDRGYPKATVRWCKNGHTISSSRINVTHEGLRIANVEPEDAGNYTCSLCRSGWGCDFVKIAVQVLSGNTGEPPQVAVSAPSIINHTDSLNLNCTVQAGTMPVSLEWSTPRGTFPTNSQSILTLPPGSFSSGEYSCSASNMYGSISKTVHVNVTVPPLPPSKNWPTQTAHENDTVMLQCQINHPANPAPSYTWRRLPEGGTPVLILSQGRFQPTLDHQLRISSVRKEDEGLYECIVENSLGRSVQVVQLQVETPNTPTTPTGVPTSSPIVGSLRLMTRQCSRQQVEELTRELTTYLNQQCNCSVTISGVSLSCNGDGTGVYTAIVNVRQSLIVQLYRYVNDGLLLGFCGTERCPVEETGDSGLLAAIVVLGVAICIAVVVTVFIMCYCIKQRRSRTDVKADQSRDPQDTSSQDSSRVYDYPRTHFAGHQA